MVTTFVDTTGHRRDLIRRSIGEGEPLVRATQRKKTATQITPDYGERD